MLKRLRTDSSDCGTTMDFQSVWLDPSAPGVPPMPCVEAATYLVNGEIKKWGGSMQVPSSTPSN
jgi:hypothetical protein